MIKRIGALLSLYLIPVLVTHVIAADKQPPVLPGGEKAVVRVHYSDQRTGNNALKSFGAQLLETNYGKGYHVMRVKQEDIDKLTAAGLRVELAPDWEEPAIEPSRKDETEEDTIPSYPCYRTVEGTFAAAEQIVANYSSIASWKDVGDSWVKSNSSDPEGKAGYDMKVLVLTNSKTTGEKPDLFLTAALHAREYATAELVTRFAEYLVGNYGTDPDVTWILDNHEIHMMLHGNPDGRKLAEDHVLWRKNTDEDYCLSDYDSRGADLNRNFSYEWNCCDGSSDEPCDQTYHGEEAASEPEITAIQNYMNSIFSDQRNKDKSNPAPNDSSGIYIDVHSYGKLVMWPWGSTHDTAPDHVQLQTLGRKFAYWNGYSPEQAIGLYPTDGTSDDHAYGELGVAAYCFELGTSFFQSCKTFESRVYPDNLESLLYAAKVVRTPYVTPSGPDAVGVMVDIGEVTAGTFVTLSATIDDTRYARIKGNEEQEPYQNIDGAEYYIDTPPWNEGFAESMDAADGLFDTASEFVHAQVDTTELTTGTHLLYVRGKDADGNWGPFSAAFLKITE
ncbi:M14 family zinc carboxypeptidase [Desulfosediminicola flagellatus]|uniref:M14 family zinc carboxypeptidase n=1 Tax=Desulfosediminicola flagellatus TaxID=2569541 RepID=UPI00142F0F62|nr:M14 family zinc carboxypeptidase [Desulfosediminicola flagellatus]